MRSKLTIGILLLALFFSPGLVMAGQLEGIIEGINCASQGKVCPKDKADPLVAITETFVLSLGGGSYYFISNLDREILARHFTDRVRVTGDISSKYRNIKAEKLEVFKNGAWETVWSWEIQQKMLDKLHGKGFD